MVNPHRKTFPDAASFETAWRSDRPRAAPPAELAARVEAMLRPSGFRLFHNGGLPRLDRRRANLREEIVFAPGPVESGGFALRFHLNHEGLGEVRARFWRPATRAPQTVASGDIGLLESPPARSLWHSETPTEVAEAIRERIVEDLLPWLDVFDDPTTLQETLMAGSLPLVDPSTALELLLAEFGPREARRYLRTRFDPPVDLGPPLQSQGFDLTTNRIPAIVGYYRL